MAEEAIARVGVVSPIDTREIAVGNGFVLVPSTTNKPRLDLRHLVPAIYYNKHASDKHIQAQVGQEFARSLLIRNDIKVTHEKLAYLLRALQLPKKAFIELSQAADWNLTRLMNYYPDVMPELIAARLGDMHQAIISFFDHKKLVKRMVPQTLGKKYNRVTPVEFGIAQKAGLKNEPIFEARHCYAVPLIKDALVVTVCESSYAYRFTHPHHPHRGSIRDTETSL